jgi:phage capsid family|nr:MAG TPA: major capsid protein [Caudoviricetes sp.]
MNNVMNDKLFLTGRAHYGEAFWKAMRGNDAAFTDRAGAKHNLTNTYLLPESTATKHSASLKEHNLFRRIGTVMNATKNDSVIWISDNDFQPEWVPGYGIIPTTTYSVFPKKDVAAHKLVIITALETDFISDLGFYLEQYLVSQFSKRFSKAEEDAFINGTGVDQPHGILTDSETGVMVSGNIGFDDVLALYFSVDKQYRSGGAWLMNDEMALKLKTLKDQNGQYL